MAQKKIVRQLSFTGGMQSATSRFLQKNEELSLAINVHGDNIGSLTKRLGFTTCGASDNPIEAAKSPSVLYDGGTFLYTHADTNIYYNNNSTDPNAGTWTAVTGGTDPTATMIIDMQRFKDIGDLYIVGATAAPTASTDFLVTQVVAAEATVPGTKADALTTTYPRAKFVIRWRDRLYFAYCYATWYVEGALIKPTRIVYTEVPVQGSLNAVATDNKNVLDNASFVNFLDTDDPITGAMSTPSAAVFFTKYGMWKYDRSTWKKAYDIGCVSHRSIKHVDIYNFWLGVEGIYVESGGKPQIISNKIGNIIKQIASPSTTFAWVDEQKYYLYVGTLTLDGISYQNCAIVYDIYANNFYIYKYRFAISSGTTEYVMTASGSFDNKTNVRQFCTASNGDAFVFSHPGDSTKYYTDGDQSSETFPIEMKVQTKRYDFEIPEENKTMDTMTVISETALGTKVRTSTDGGEWQNWGSVQENVQTLPVSPSEGKDIRIEFSEVGTTQGPQINGVVFNVEQKTETHD